jgi:uncharacterized protein
LEGEGSGHDWWHVYRVWQTAKDISKKEKSDSFIVELAALLHDIADWKFHNGDETVGPKIAGKWLTSQGLNSESVKTVQEIIEDVSFKGAGVKKKIRSKEGKIVQDADRLDAMGAIGIARCFAYGGFKHYGIYNPEIKPKIHKTAEEYRRSKSSSINHFYEKLLLLRNLMNTRTAKKMAEKRHKFMKNYLNEFFKEWKSS